MKALWKRLQEIQPYSWETLLLLSLFSWLVAWLIEDPVLREVASSFGWIFLIFGVSWALSGKKLPLPGIQINYGPWVTGALICIFLFREQILNDSFSTALVIWPLISASIAALRRFIAPGPTYKIPDPPGRQDIVIVLLFGILLSCWIQFYFVVQNWLADYPSLLAESFRQSNFVVRLDSDSIDPPQGILMLNSAEAILQNDLAGRPWGAVELWLMNLDSEKQELESEAKASIARFEESQWWNLDMFILQGQPDYTLQLQAIWRGPSSQPQGYTIGKTCALRQISTRTVRGAGSPSTVVSTQVTCDPVVLPEALRVRN
nr:DUF5357 family protein [Oculatella sp. LEGE 06141]